MSPEELEAFWTPERLADYMKKQKAAGGRYEEVKKEIEVNDGKRSYENYSCAYELFFFRNRMGL